jgi:hypothetical protein
MPLKMPFFHDYPAHRYQVALDGVVYEIRLTYRQRTSSWYLDLWDEQGNEIVKGRRLSPNWSPQGGMVTDGPPGLLVAFGRDPYDRYEIDLFYFTEEELLAAKPVAADLLPVELA